jgi:hypothetical protein
LSLPYVLWKNNTTPNLLNEKEKNNSNNSNNLKGSVWDNKLFGTIQQHRK